MNEIIVPKGFNLAKDGKLWLPGDTFFKDAWATAQYLKRAPAFDTIFCVARGGYPLGAVVGNCLGKKDIQSLSASSYQGDRQGEVVVNSNFPPHILEARGAGTLILEDLFDTGATARALQEVLPEACFVAVYSKPKGDNVAHYVQRKLPSDDVWIVFPWEEDPHNFIPV